MSTEIVEHVHNLLPDFELDLVSQGAEALVFVTNQHPYLALNPSFVSNLIENKDKYICKYRPKKPYRHPKLDLQLTKSRTAGEAKMLAKLETLNIKAPKLIALDATNGIIWMECLGFELENGQVSSLKNYLWHLEQKGLLLENQEVEQVMFKVGSMIAQLHLNEIIHGDLTSSNLMITSAFDISLIDFGLSSYSNLCEDKAVDLYVLERALISTHSVNATNLNEYLLSGYKSEFKTKTQVKQLVDIERRLSLVRMRGRKRSQLG